MTKSDRLRLNLLLGQLTTRFSDPGISRAVNETAAAQTVVKAIRQLSRKPLDNMASWGGEMDSFDRQRLERLCCTMMAIMDGPERGSLRIDESEMRTIVRAVHELVRLRKEKAETA